MKGAANIRINAGRTGAGEQRILTGCSRRLAGNGRAGGTGGLCRRSQNRRLGLLLRPGIISRHGAGLRRAQRKIRGHAERRAGCNGKFVRAMAAAESKFVA